MVARVRCEAPVGGDVDLPPTAVEAASGYDAELAAVSLEELPAELPLEELSATERALLAYALDWPASELGPALDVAAAREEGEMGQAVLASFAVVDPAGAGGIDLDFFRRGFHRFYACQRGFPATLDDFEALHGPVGEVAERRTVDPSPVKNAPRRLREDRDRHLYVAETLVDGGVRETEILLADTRRDGALDFLVYGSDGALADRSEFWAITGGHVVSATPYACMSCHVDYSGPRYDVLVPIDF